MDEICNNVLSLFRRYYNINTDDPEEPFFAEAVFESHNEQYYLIKAAKVADINVCEYVYFARTVSLSAKELRRFVDRSWDIGLAKVKPSYSHRNTDVTLFVIAESIDEEVKKLIKKTRRYKSYKWGFNGWSNFRLVVIECSSGTAFYNHQGRSLKKLVGNIFMTL